MEEKIFLVLLQREYEAWIAELEKLTMGKAALSREELAPEIAHTIERRELLLKRLTRIIPMRS